MSELKIVTNRDLWPKLQDFLGIKDKQVRTFTLILDGPDGVPVIRMEKYLYADGADKAPELSVGEYEVRLKDESIVAPQAENGVVGTTILSSQWMTCVRAETTTEEAR